MIRTWNLSFFDGIIASIVTLVGYFSPVKDTVHFMIGLFIIDVIYGWRVDRKLNKYNKEKNYGRFDPMIVWDKTIPKMVLSLILLLGFFTLDSVTGQHFIEFYNIVGWFICGLLLASIAENGYIITGWKTLSFLDILIKKKIKDQTGIEIDNKENNN